MDDFVLGGFGRWPVFVLSNTAALLGPPGDPAKVAEVAELGTAFQRIRDAGVPFVVNDNSGMSYMLHTAAAQAGIDVTDGMIRVEGSARSRRWTGRLGWALTRSGA